MPNSLDKTLSEQEIRSRYITPALNAAGWKQEHISEEHTFTAGEVVVRGTLKHRKEAKRYDYLLSTEENYPIAIVEAKDANHEPDSGIQQAMDYARILDVPFAYSSNGDKFFEHDMLTGEERQLKMSEFPTVLAIRERLRKEKNYTPEQERIIDIPYYSDASSFSPRYYQRIAINKTVEAVARGQKRILLVMATGTGKTYTAFQILHRLHSWKKQSKVLYLADRNILIDQTMREDFKPFSAYMTKVQSKDPKDGYEIYMSLYGQWVKPEDQMQPGEKQPYEKYSKDFFDFIVVDECHRASAKEDSEWRKILEHFSSATQIGMTATPKEEKGADNIAYFGEPVYTYSLKQGIEDGFLAPYRVTKSFINVDMEGYTAKPDEKDLFNVPLESLYTQNEFGTRINISRRQQVVAHRITQMLKQIGKMTKTIVFCPREDEALIMRDLLAKENQDMMRKNPNYVVRITSSDVTGKKLLDDFMDPDEDFPVIATTSDLLSTGVNVKTCGLIVFDKKVESMTLFKQMLGRGTRIYTKHGHNKLSFEVLDFRNVTQLFSDPAFDGTVEEREYKGGYEMPHSEDDGGGSVHEHTPLPPKVFVTGHRGIKIVNEQVLTIGDDGKPMQTESVTDYTRKTLKDKYSTLNAFVMEWDNADRKKKILDGIEYGEELIKAVREEDPSLKDVDVFDIICHVAFDQKPLTRKERMNNVKKRGYLNKYSGKAREVLEALMDKYQEDGVLNFEDSHVLELAPFNTIGSRAKIMKLFGGKNGYNKAITEIENELYKQA